jgi:hypothetical protein
VRRRPSTSTSRRVRFHFVLPLFPEGFFGAEFFPTPSHYEIR